MSSYFDYSTLVSPTDRISADQSQISIANLVGADRAGKIMNTNEGLGYDIAIIDTGVAGRDSFFKNRMSDQGACFGTEIPGEIKPTCPGNKPFVEGREAGFYPDNEEYAHATMVAGVAAEVAPQAKILSINVASWNEAADADGNHSTIYSTNVNEGLDWLGHNNGRYAAVNLSLGYLSYTSTEAAKAENPISWQLIANLISRGVTVTTSAGNHYGLNFTNNYAALSYSAGYIDGNIAVGASCYDSNEESHSVCDYSNSAPWVTVLAPAGEPLVYHYPGNKTVEAEGTSLTTPAVAGAAAALRSQADNYNQRNFTPGAIEWLVHSRSWIDIPDDRQAKNGWQNRLRLPLLRVDGAAAFLYLGFNRTSTLSLPTLRR